MLRKITAFFLILIFAPLFTLEVLIFSFHTRVLNENIYKEKLEQHAIYDLLYDQLSPPLVEDLLKSTENTGFKFTEAEIKTFLSNVFPKNVLKKELNKNIDNLFLYLKGEKADLELRLSLGEIKNNAKPQLLSLIRSQLRDFPTCSSPEDIEASQRGDLPACFPPGIEKEEYLKILEKELGSIIDDLLADLPASFDLSQSLDKAPFVQAKEMTAKSNTLMVVLLITLLILLIGIAAALSYSFSSVLRSIGFTFFLAATLTLGLLFFLRYLALRVAREVMAGILSPLPVNAQEKIFTFVSDLITSILDPVIYQLSILSAIGILLFFILSLVKKWPSKNQPAP